MQLTPDDPLGFEDYQGFANKVAAALDTTFGLSPDVNESFMPVRAGEFTVSKMRLIDVFGKGKMSSPKNIALPQSMGLQASSDWASLRPRFAQPARMRFEFLQADKPHQLPATNHPLSSPVCGWIVPNLLDHSFFIYDKDGQHRGIINQNGIWDGQSLEDHPALVHVAQCNTQIRVNSLREVASSRMTLPSSRSCKTRAPSL